MVRILIIDDEDMVRFTLRQFLSREGYDVLEAADGREGLKLFREARPDLVITDIIMPEKDGIETVMELRRDFGDAKLIAMSGGGRIGNMEVLETAEKLGADRTLAKPIEKEALIATVKACLASPKAA